MPEVESRYTVPDRILFDRLRQARSLGPFRLEPLAKVRVADTYLDTPGRALYRQGWALRLRSDGGSWVATLKGPKQSQGAILSRSEVELALPTRSLDVNHWPAGEVRSAVEALTGGGALAELARVEQTRHRAEVREKGRAVALLSLDVVAVYAEALRQRTYMLEAELLEDGTPDDLERLDGILTAEWGLVPEPRSKLHRALDLVERSEPLDEGLAARLAPATPEVLVARYGADADEGRRIAALAGRLAELLPLEPPAPPERQRDLQTAALLHAIGEEARRAPAHVAARDVLTRQPLEGQDEMARQIVAAAVYLQRKPISPERVAEVIPASWPAETRRQALWVSALLRMAVGIARRGGPDVQVRAVERAGGRCRVLLSGTAALAAAQRAARRSELWGMVSATPLEWGALQPSGDGEVVALGSPGGKVLGINPWDSMPAAAYKVLSYYDQQMLAHEAGARAGVDPEELHDMRVATRRLRSALRLLGPYLPAVLTPRVIDGLRALGAALGAVRDLDVALLKAEAYGAAQGEAVVAALEPLLASWRHQRDLARTRLVRHLEGRAYQRFRDHMRALLASLEGEDPLSRERRPAGEMAPRFLYLYWQSVRAYDVLLGHAPIELLHLLRIDCKRLRYGIEFFRDVLPTEVIGIIPEVVALQDHLGEMRDAVLAAAALDAYLARPRPPEVTAAVSAYREACHAARDERLATFPEAWARFNRADVVRAFMALPRAHAPKERADPESPSA